MIHYDFTRDAFGRVKRDPCFFSVKQYFSTKYFVSYIQSISFLPSVECQISSDGFLLSLSMYDLGVTIFPLCVFGGFFGVVMRNSTCYCRLNARICSYALSIIAPMEDRNVFSHQNRVVLRELDII